MAKTALITSSVKKEGWPVSSKPELAFAGRSNSGKSSLINALIGGKHARTSSKPGKTILINFYDYEDKILFADLPGYGYAKVAKKLRHSWKGLIEEYLLERDSLKAVFIISDVRRGLESDELDLADWLQQAGLPFYFIFTKTDKLSSNELANRKKHLSSSHKTIKTRFFYVSVLKKSGIEELKAEIDNIGGI